MANVPKSKGEPVKALTVQKGTRINLLSWRQERRRRWKQYFYASIVMALLSVGGIMFAWHQVNAMRIDNQKARNELLNDEINLANAQLKTIENLEKIRDQVISRINLIYKLQASRPESVHFLDEIARLTPDGIVVTKLRQSDKKIVLEGYAQSNAIVSVYMRRIEASSWLDEPKLEIIRDDTGGGISGIKNYFRLRFNQKADDQQTQINQNDA